MSGAAESDVPLEVKSRPAAHVWDFGLKLVDGEYQVEISDEGLMTEDLEACLRVVIEAAAGQLERAGNNFPTSRGLWDGAVVPLRE